MSPVTEGRGLLWVGVAVVGLAWVFTVPVLWEGLSGSHGLTTAAAVVLTALLALVPVAPLGLLVALREHSVRLGARLGALDVLLVLAHLVVVGGLVVALLGRYGVTGVLLVLAGTLAQEALTVAVLRVRLHTPLPAS
ncbi:hypothetical protein AB0900_31945 [Streptomyces cellulosae]|uniref:Integral membrane protein n=2 Tax=Streptomyces TaxID=1883 RepID=A0ABU3JJH8_9ACTN|nr:hypothetical protein [Streptomyces sp. McG8]MDQ0491283.1 ACR3 family arsenite efflux pump ArsB [Streptomyces thermodiastaticus]MDT6974136.1 hypothetical protein [Streptomyces thermocarboxydus]WSB39352.1 hypothetical protein OG853_00110 [Streptomyces cellulosae]UVT13702.1 hypothetical protein AY578_33445 [Streptomyces thermocarboxydus]